MTDALAMLVRERERLLAATLEAHAEEIARACHSVARRLHAGGTLLAYGTGPAATDAAHVAVEFMHPVIVGKRALPALALPNDPTGAAGIAALARPGDVALGLDHGCGDLAVAAFLERARGRGLLTLALAGEGRPPAADHALTVPSRDRSIVQEIQETIYHVLWELVHVFFEHPGLLVEACDGDACITCGDVAVRGRVVDVRPDLALVEVDGRREEVATDLVAPVAVGDEVLCHAGVALQRVGPAER